MQDTYEDTLGGRNTAQDLDNEMDARANFSTAEYDHKMRLSIDIHSIKDASFKGLVYAKYSANPTLGIRQFSTLPAVQITKTHEEKLNNSFASYEFTSSKGNLYPTLNETNLEVEIWHQDRHKKDMLIGLALLPVDKILTSPIRKTPQSFVRVYDAWVPIDEVDDDRNPQDRVGLLRVIVYLEDLGPVAMIRSHEQKVTDKYKDDIKTDVPIIPASIALKQTKDIGDDNNLMNEISSLEYKIIWELETWKKSEEAKFKYQLKSKEIEYFTKLNEEWRKKELERDKIFKSTEAKLQTVESRLKQKANELQKREQKIVLLEEELKQRISETARQLSVKEEEISNVKKKTRDEKTQIEKEKNILAARCENQEALIKKVEQEYLQFRKEQENSPVNIIRTELSAKNLEINDLKKELEKANQIKDEYRKHYDKLRNEIIRMKKNNDSVREDLRNQYQTEIEHLKLRLNSMTMAEDKENITSLRNELADLKSKTVEKSASGASTSSLKNPFTKNLYQQGSANKTGGRNPSSAYSTAKKPEQTKPYPEPKNEFERLVNEREELLSSGCYQEEDALILEINENISRLQQR